MVSYWLDLEPEVPNFSCNEIFLGLNSILLVFDILMWQITDL